MDDIFNGKCKVFSSELMGRYLVANKDIEPGETILKEDAIIVSPLWHSLPRCANCFRETCTICNKCNVFPLCIHCTSHNNFDCSFMANQRMPSNYLVEHFSIFAPLKALIAFEKSSCNIKDIVLNMESHCEHRKKQLIWDVLETNVVKPMLDQLRNCFQSALDEAFVHKLCGIFDVNAFEVRGHGDGDILRALYPNAALLAHSCVANTLISVSDEYQLKVYASTHISKGDIIYYNYTSCLMGTAERRKQLSLGKYFLCECRRCQDPTELGTHLSSIYCQNCNELIAPGNDDHWTCLHCSNKVSASLVLNLFSQIEEDIKKSSDDLKLMEMLLLRYSSVLSPSHYFIVDLKQNIASAIRDICLNSVHKPGRAVLNRKIKLCDDLLLVLNRLEPGISRLVGIAMYEKFVPLLNIAHMNYESGEIQGIHYLEQLQSLENLIKSAIKMLLYEQVQSAEGRLLKAALHEISELRKTICLIQQRLSKISNK